MKFEIGRCLSDLVAEYNLAKSPLETLLGKNVIKAANVVKGVKLLTMKPRPQAMEEVAKLL